MFIVYSFDFNLLRICNLQVKCIKILVYVAYHTISCYFYVREYRCVLLTVISAHTRSRSRPWPRLLFTWLVWIFTRSLLESIGRAELGVSERASSPSQNLLKYAS